MLFHAGLVLNKTLFCISVVDLKSVSLKTINMRKVGILLLGTSPFLRLCYCYLFCTSNISMSDL